MPTKGWITMEYKSLSVALRDVNFRDSLKLDVIVKAATDLAQAFKSLRSLEEDNDLKADALLSTQWIMTCFRNACVCCERNQLMILKQSDVLETTLHVLQFNTSFKNQDMLSELSKTKTISLQFLGNLVAANRCCQIDVWKKMFPDLAKLLLERLSAPQKNILCMVIYNCTLNSVGIYGTKEFSTLMAQIIDFCRSNETEWGLLILQHVVSTEEFLDLFDQLADHQRQRLILLDFLHDCISESETSTPRQSIVFAVKLFKRYSGAIVNGLVTQMDSFKEALELVLSLIKILCSATSLEKYISTCTNESLIDDAIYFLNHIVEANRDPESMALAEQSSTHNVFGLKRDIIRLIGNLCYKNKANQIRVRELGGINAILDNCKIDDQNPYISQWAVYAIRNLCENNPENQDVILQLERQGVANLEELEKLGINVRIVNGKVKIGSEGKNL